MDVRWTAGFLFCAVFGALPQSPPTAAPPPALPAAVPKDDTAELKQRLLKVEQENARLKARLDLLTKQVESLTGSYLSHYHEVKGTVGDGLTTMEGKTFVTGSYVDNDLRRTGGPQPPYHPVYAPQAAKPKTTTAPKPAPKAAAKNPQ